MKNFLYLLTASALLSCGQDNRKPLSSSKETGDTATVTRQFIPIGDTISRQSALFLNDTACIGTYAFLTLERRQFFPFNQATRIELVSFEEGLERMIQRRRLSSVFLFSTEMSILRRQTT